MDHIGNRPTKMKYSNHITVYEDIDT